MDRIPCRKVSAFTALKESGSGSQLSASTHQNASLIPTVGSVVERFNFGLKEKLRKTEKDKQELETKYQELLKSMEFISSENDKLKSSRIVLEEDRKVLESKYHKLKSVTDVMKADYDRVNAKLSNLEVANESLKQTSWIRRSRKSKGNSATNSHGGAAAANEISILKETLVKKDGQISELEKQVTSVQEKLRQAVQENQSAKSIKITVDSVDNCDEVGVDDDSETVVDEAVLYSLDKSAILVKHKQLLARYNKRKSELKEHQDQILNLEKSCSEQRKELLILNMEVNKMKSDSMYVLSGSNNALHHLPLSSSMTMLGLPSSVVKSASFDNGRKISLPARREAASSPDVSVLQNCLKLSLAEKKTLEEEIKELKQELSSLKQEQSSAKSSRSQSVNTPPSASNLKTSRSQSAVVSPKIVEDGASKSAKGDISMLQSCLQLAISEKKTLAEENEMLKASVEEWQQKAKSLEDQLTKLEKLAPKREELNKLKASVQSLEKENSALLNNEKTMSSKMKSLDAKNSQLQSEKTKLAEEVEKLNRKVKTMNEKEKQQKAAEKHHKSVQTTTERSIERNRPGSADSKSAARVTFYRTNSQNSESDVQVDHKKVQVAESHTPETKVDHKKMQVAEGQAPEMKVACRLNITSTSPSSDKHLGKKHLKFSHKKSLSSDYSTSKDGKQFSDCIDGESSENKSPSSSSPVNSKPAVTSVKVSTSIKKETPTKLNALHLRNTSPQLQVHPTSSHVQAHTGASQSHASTVSYSPIPGAATTQSSSNTRLTSGAVSPSGSVSHSKHVSTHQQSTPHVTTTSHVTPMAVTHSSVNSNQSSSGTSNQSSSGTTQSSTVTTTTHQPSFKPRPFLKANTTMSFVSTTSKPTGSPSHPPLVVQKSTPVPTVPATVITSPPKSNTDNSASSENIKPPLQKTTSLTVSSSSTEVVRRRTKTRSQQILDPLKRSSAYFPTDVTNQSIMEENELHRCGSLESLKSALFHAASAKVHPSVASSSVSSSSNAASINTTASTTATVTSTSFSSPTPRVVSFSKPETKFETKPAEAKKEVKFVNNNQHLSTTRARPRAARHQSINTPLPQVSSYYTPSTPNRYAVE